ncbi:hypothetical protein QWY31_11800 [Cytophagales bacterium LB-30]|uniref:Uncharacterized protein n=1 Tax=Shiella aurantiaca TaxID=3058365 RepID=A0ABT8F8B7_9BACT|nr:hypothetical protein [Shiella aurantiaca]MDN4166191.1 hypothetical protein [Shiella aurantiaca]
MTKISVLGSYLVVLFIASSCVNHKIHRLWPCQAPLVQSKLLLEANAWMSPSTSLRVVDQLNEALLSCQTTAFFQQSLEMELWAKGVKNLRDTSQYTALRQLGFTHLLFISKENSYAEGGMLDTRTSYELENNTIPYSEALEKRTTLTFSLVPIQAPHAQAFQFSISTTVSPLLLKNEDASETYLNISSDGKAIARALKKGLKELEKECACQ